MRKFLSIAASAALLFAVFAPGAFAEGELWEAEQQPLDVGMEINLMEMLGPEEEQVGLPADIQQETEVKPAEYEADEFIPADTATVYTDIHMVKLPDCEKPGFRLIGWNTQKDGSGTMYLPGQTIDIGDGENIELFGIWEELNPEADSVPMESVPIQSGPEVIDTAEPESPENVTGEELPEELPVKQDIQPEEVLFEEEMYFYAIDTSACRNIAIMDYNGKIVTGLGVAAADPDGYAVLCFAPMEGYDLPETISFCYEIVYSDGTVENASPWISVYTDGSGYEMENGIHDSAFSGDDWFLFEEDISTPVTATLNECPAFIYDPFGKILTIDLNELGNYTLRISAIGEKQIMVATPEEEGIEPEMFFISQPESEQVLNDDLYNNSAADWIIAS